MIGVGINAVGIVVGGIVGLKKRKPLTAANESFFKVAIGAGMVFLGLQLAWQNLNGPPGVFLKQLFIVLISMSLGKLLGRLLNLQKLSNSVGKYATGKMADARSSRKKFSEGFVVCALLACLNPLAVYAATQEGLSGNGFAPVFVVKAVMDGLAAMAFVSVFAWGTIFAAVPVMAFLGTIYLATKSLLPFLHERGLVDSILATDGLLIFCVALIILNLKKIELADYIPSLAVAPLITLLWK